MIKRIETVVCDSCKKEIGRIDGANETINLWTVSRYQICPSCASKLYAKQELKNEGGGGDCRRFSK